MKIFFDVDYTIISFEGRLRPHVHDVFEKLKDDGHDIYIWSGVGLRHEVIERYELGKYVSGVYWKPREDYRARMVELGVDIEPDYIIDDDYGIVQELGGFMIKAYSYSSPSDREMWTVYDEIQKHIQNKDGV